MTDEPNLAVVVSRLDTISSQLNSIVVQIADDRREVARTYIPREVYETRHAALSQRVQEMEADNKESARVAAETRRQLMFIVLGALLTALSALIVAVYLGSGGPP